MSRRIFILTVAVVGLLGAAAATIILLVIDNEQNVDPVIAIDLSDEELGLFTDDQAALVAEFDADWERWRRGSFWIESSVERERVSDGGVLNSTQIYAQLPPDRVIAGLGATTGMFGGSLVNCAGTQVKTATGCISGQSSSDYDEVVEQESNARSTYFEVGAPAYLLRRDEQGCYGLLLTRSIATPPYGQTSTFCFDQATGALISSVVDRQTTVETTTATELRTDVTREEIASLIDGDPG
ncbi:MAG: hypothetical protein IH940_00310 [Acidobacteria bacterium]|nr:hypothetical protein [Acidobacteriota bacterium]